jgi:hypothetical protein
MRIDLSPHGWDYRRIVEHAFDVEYAGQIRSAR